MKNKIFNQIRKTNYLSKNETSEGIFKRKSKVSSKSLVEFTRNLSVMLNANLPLVNALKIISSQTEDKYFSTILKKIIKKVEKGNTFSSSLKQYPRMFDSLYVQMVRVGESAGVLGEVLKRHMIYMEKTTRLKQKMIKALTYPAIIILTAVLAVTFLLLFVIPTFAEIFSEMNAQLPAATETLINISRKLHIYIIIFIFFVVAVIFLVKRLLKNKNIRIQIDRFSLYIPLFGNLLKKNFITRFTRTTGVLLENSLPFTESLSIAMQTIRNSYIRSKLKKIKKNVQKGMSFSSSIKKTGVFPQMLCQMIAVGETTDTLDETLIYIADNYESEIDSIIDTITTIMEPLLIIILGIIIAALLVVLYLPMFDIVNVINY